MTEHRPEEGGRIEQEDPQRYPEHDDPESARERVGLADRPVDDRPTDDEAA